MENQKAALRLGEEFNNYLKNFKLLKIKYKICEINIWP